MKKVGYYFLLFLLTTILVASCYLKVTQPTSDIPELLFCINYGLENSDFSPLFEAFKYCIPAIVVILTILIYTLDIVRIGKYEKKNKILLNIIKNKKKNTIILSIIIAFIALYNINFHHFVYYSIATSNFIEENYVDPKDVNVTFKKKNNLILIFLESFESTLLEKSEGGKWEYHLLPEIEELNKDEDVTIFKKNKNTIGMSSIPGATYTTAAVFAHQSALPFKYSPLKRLTESDFMKGAYSLGDILKDNGYKNELISAATTSFGGIKEYFTNHGSYDIIDIDNYQNYGLEITDDDLGPWGFNDNYLFETAKKRISILAKEEQPFNLTMIGIDSHFPTGHIGNYSVDKYSNDMENSYATESKLVGKFIDWIKEQYFYEDTTIVILGDHLSMATSFYRNKKDRYVYSSYVNSVAKKEKEKNRIYTTLDTYPTILASIGAEIEGDKLGLGVNLFGDEETLAEKYGLDYLSSSLSKKSVFYNKKIMVK